MSEHHTHCCGETKNFDGLDPTYRRILWLVIAINAGMFALETFAGHLANSQALQADALDFFADALTYGLSLAVIGMPLRTRAKAALLKGVSLAFMGLWVFGSTLYQTWVLQTPHATVMGGMAILAFGANLVSVLLLMRYKDGDSNVRSVWLCSRNDMLGNAAVLVAAFGVFGTGTAWPDLLVAGLMAGLFLHSSSLILRQSIRELMSNERSSPL